MQCLTSSMTCHANTLKAMNTQDFIVNSLWQHQCCWLTLLGVMMMERLTTVSAASIASIAIVAGGFATVATVVATVVVSSIGIVTIVVTAIAPIATLSGVAFAFTALVIACTTIGNMSC